MEASGIHYIEQSVKAIADFSENENQSGTAIAHRFSMRTLSADEGRFAAWLRVSSDLEESENPPYEFQLEAMMWATTGKPLGEEKLQQLKQMLFQMLFASARERLASITSRAMWDALHLAPTVYQQANDYSDEEE